METLLLMVLCGGGFLVAYHTYGRFLARKIFKLDDRAAVPSKELADGIDYVPAKKGIIFGHHFTSIAGTGPIVGPAIGIIWGWVPAILWVVFGSIFMGAVHDFGSLVVSIRNEGTSISEVAAKYINKRVRFIFFVIIFFTLWIVIAIFGVVIAVVFKSYPESVLSVWLQLPIAIALGHAVYKKNRNITLATIVAVTAMYLTVGLGAYIEIKWPGSLSIPDFAWMPATGMWTILLLIYAWIASTLPVNILLQPRDYINAWQLFVAMALIVGGIAVASVGGDLSMAAPAFNPTPEGAPSMWPFLFVTIACGAISGFHSLVASGTSPKQVSNERDTLFIGYGSMLMEGALAILVIICVGAGIGMAYKLNDGTILTGGAAWNEHYATWGSASGLGAKLTAFVTGAANIIGALKLPPIVGTAVMGVFVASFAGTTLDTSVRLQRYVISELTTDLKLKALSNRWVATSIAVITGAMLAFATGADGKGAMKLWPLFGSVNQLLAALALLVISMYLKKKGGLKYILTAVPCAAILTMTCWALTLQLTAEETGFFAQKNWLLAAIGTTVLALAVWMVIETVIVFAKGSAKED
ncbi:MAG: carbon starvation protein A [Anaerohalosphaera sp.]|nr:carbon starvation protein A [Anaerohalosphaera sp.]